MAGLGLFGAIEMARNSLASSRNATEVTGHNLANSSNPAYARQRVQVESAPTLPTTIGPQGTGANVVAFQQIRDKTLDKYLVSEKYLTGYYSSKLTTLQQGEARLGQILDRQALDPKSGNIQSTGLAERITDFFNTFQSLSAAPTSNAERRLSVVSGQELADRFQRAYERLDTLRTDINTEITDSVAEVNRLLESTSKLSQKISATETKDTGIANELRDQRQGYLEELAEFTDFAHTENSDGKMTLTVAGIEFIKDDALVGQYQTTTITPAPTPVQQGMTYIKSTNNPGLLSVTGGKIKGLIDARDDTIYVLLNEVDKVASNLITEVNTVHAAGYDLSGNSSLDFFTGTGASSIAVNATLISDPRRIQASAFADEPGDNSVAKQIAGLAEKAITALNNVTFGENYSNAVAQFGQAIANTETQLEAQQAVERLLLKQRDSISGVSIDEEVTNMMIYQRAFQASSRLISTIDTLLADVLNMKR